METRERVINTWRDPYDEGFSTCRPKQITINSGLTVLVGCNGAGKTTLLHNIKDELEKENISFHLYDNLRDGGSHSWSEAAFSGNWAFVATSMTASEGENINMNIGNLATKLTEFRDSGRISNKASRIADIFSNKPYETPDTKERWLLFDAIDSGLSVDNVIELKNFFRILIKDFAEKGYELYIVVSANEFELARDEDCFDVMNGKYIRFADYDDYRKFIVKSREKKDRRYKK